MSLVSCTRVRVMRALIAAFALIGIALPDFVSAQQPARWKLVEEWRVGGDPDGAVSFGDVRGLRVLKDGRLVLLESKDQLIHFFSAQGKAVRSVGKKGSGPGEFREANGIVVLPNGEIVVNDPSNNRFSFLSSTGDYLRSVRPQNWGFSYIWDVRIDPDGRLNEYVSFLRPGDTSNSQGRRVWTKDFASADTVYHGRCASANPQPSNDTFRYSYRTERGGGTMTVPYAAPITVSVTTPDGTSWSGVWPGYATLERHPSGECETTATIRLSGARVAVSKAARDSAEESVTKFAARYGVTPDLSKIPRELPAYSTLYADELNRLWVGRQTASGTRTFEVFTSCGTPVAVLDMPVILTAYRPALITRDHLYGFTSDDDGVQYLVSLRIVSEVVTSPSPNPLVKCVH